CFFFQAEDGIRDRNVTGVQTCALPISLFKRHFHLVKQSKLSYSKELNQAVLMNLIQMSPLTWNVKKEQLDVLINQGSSGITVDLDILVGINGHAKRGGM